MAATPRPLPGMAPASPMVQPMPTPPASPPPGQPQAENPIAVHVKVVAILEIVWGVLAAIGALGALFVFTTGAALFQTAAEEAQEAEWLAGASLGLGLLIAAVLGTLAAIAFVGGIKLLHHRRLGKTLTFVSAAVSLLNFPVGTAYGVYAFVILTRPDTERLLVE